VLLGLLSLLARQVVFRRYPGNVAFIQDQDPPAFALRSNFKNHNERIGELGEDVAHPLDHLFIMKQVDLPWITEPSTILMLTLRASIFLLIILTDMGVLIAAKASPQPLPAA
jgi:hypothetical protein